MSMTFRKHAARRLTTGIVATAALALTLTAYGAGNPSGHKQLTKLHIAMVPVLDAESFLYAKAKGYYKDAGLDVTFSTNDAGPAVVTGVINGTYDAAAAAWFPVAIAISKGAKLTYIMTSNVEEHGHDESAIVVKPNSGITSYKDLEGKTVATNALTSLVTLAVKMGMKKAGADPNSIKFVALPFKTSIQAVAQGHVDAAVTVNPFPTIARAAGLKVFGDPIVEAAPRHGTGLVLFTSKAGAGKHAQALAAFTQATFRAAKELNGDEDLARKVAHNVVGLPADIAQKVPLPHFATKPIDVGALQKQLDHAYEYGYLGHPVKARDVVVGQ